jgi:RNA polymerase sigma-70 factor (ECF subfamily)
MDKSETHFKITLNSQTDKAKQANQAEDVFFSQQYRKTVTPIFRYLFSCVQNIHDAEDLTSQTFITAYENLAKLRDPNKFTAWVFTIARNKAYDFFRRSQRHPNVNFDEKIDQKSVNRRKFFLKDKDRLIDLKSLIENLSQCEQEYLRLRIVAELPWAEIASILKQPETRIKKRYYRLLKRLQAKMEI